MSVEFFDTFCIECIHERFYFTHVLGLSEVFPALQRFGDLFVSPGGLLLEEKNWYKFALIFSGEDGRNPAL